METSSSFDTNSFSHPGERLGNHLARVAGNTKMLLARAGYNFSIIAPEHLERAALLAAALHDIGKSTTYFQDYLLTDKPFDPDLKAHAKVSGVLAREVLQKSLEPEVTDPVVSAYLPLLTWLAVKRHHGNLGDIKDENDLPGSAVEADVLARQLKAMDSNDLAVVSLLIEQLTGISTELPHLAGNLDVPGLKRRTSIVMPSLSYRKLDEWHKLEYYFLGLTLVSLLLHSDKRDVILKETDLKPLPVPGDIVENFRERKGFGKGTSELDLQKEKAFFGVLDKLKSDFKPGRRFYSITLPTGLGKTITSFRAALELCKLAGGERRMVFTIPFTSIIDQTFGVYGDIVGLDDSRVMIKHHHLAEPVYKAGDDTPAQEKSEFLIETWESSIVVTTFVQLFGSLITNSKSRLLKLPNLARSVIVLDEVQNLPYKHWKLVNQTLKVFADVYDVYFILLTATQPLIFIPVEEIHELVPDHESFFRFFNRTRLHNLLGTPFANAEELAGHVIEYAGNNPEKDVMVILNTKRMASDVFELIATMLPDDKVYYLSTSVSPYERKIILEDKIKRDDTPGRRLLITTQLVEAGVDISFDTVFRQIAPVDSILQAAGRANRYNTSEEPADVFIFCFDGNEDKSKFVYGAELLDASKRLLNANLPEGGLSEEHYLGLISAYFKILKEYSENLSSKFLDHACALEYKQAGSFNLIEELGNPVSVYLFLNDKARQLWGEFKEIMRKDAPSYEKKREFSAIKSRFYDFVINVNVPERERINIFNREPEFGFQTWDPELHDSFYTYTPENFRENKGFTKNTSAVL
ncbi:MAG: hypothetical protein AMXMBFR49_20410 [Chlorobiota bacterium]